jgi:hypothetical protein
MGRRKDAVSRIIRSVAVLQDYPPDHLKALWPVLPYNPLLGSETAWISLGAALVTFTASSLKLFGEQSCTVD